MNECTCEIYEICKICDPEKHAELSHPRNFPPFAKGDIVVWIGPASPPNCFSAEHDPIWGECSDGRCYFEGWTYGRREIKGNIRKATFEDLVFHAARIKVELEEVAEKLDRAIVLMKSFTCQDDE